MKINKYFTIALLAATTLGAMSSCSDDDNLGEAPRLFRPVASLETNSNTIKVTWDNINGATEYQLKLYRVASIDANGDNVYEQVTTATCASSPYTFTDLAWDEKYHVAISCKNAAKGSGEYTTNDVNINYISCLTTSKAIDNASRISWNTDGEVIKAIIAKPAGEGESITVLVSDAEFQAGYKDVYGLTPETSYTFYTYKDAETFNNSTYAGKLTATTKASTNFDEKYGVGLWLDIRDWDMTGHADTLQKAEFWALVSEGMTVILRGEEQYKVNNNIKFDRSVTFVTGPTLGGNATFLSSGGMTCATNANVQKVKFEDIDFISDKAIEGGGYEIATNTDKGFGGRQVFNENNTSSTLGELIFKNCTITGYRAVVRAQSSTDNIGKIEFNGCIINGVGDQGVVTCADKGPDWNTINVLNSTITNVVMFCDMRATVTPPILNFDNCTFCYAPIETSANANTPLFRFNSNAAIVNINNTLFGPALATENGAGSTLQTYKPGNTIGSVFLNGASALVSVSKSFKTNFKWAEIGANATTYPIDGLNELSMDETQLWQAPSDGDFKVIGNIGEEGIGDPRWQQ